ncbi:Hypothetical predicted protein [Mytilus galloprovincialis]|uniref:Ig-like domain-containing protein n=1 Tax=Mytilus galloprovincialis TaxID=29158 RepID=A0A8B6HKG8_MYTGA|nr:Hypothetical predicted protein [Mytilus galloprovincialis]
MNAYSQALPNVTIHTTYYKVLIGGTITLQCKVTDISSAFEVQWHYGYEHGYINITNDKANKYNVSTTNTQSLTIFNAESNDQGIYKCTAEKQQGIDEITLIFLRVIKQDLDKIFRGTNEVFRLKMLDPSFETPQELETAIKNLSADFSDFVIYCNFEGRECNESLDSKSNSKYGKCWTGK